MPRLATILANVFVALGKVQETIVWASCVTLKLQPPLWARVSYLQDGELDEVTFPRLLALKGSDSMKPMSLSDTKTTSSQEIKG